MKADTQKSFLYFNCVTVKSFYYILLAYLYSSTECVLCQRDSVQTRRHCAPTHRYVHHNEANERQRDCAAAREKEEILWVSAPDDELKSQRGEQTALAAASKATI